MAMALIVGKGFLLDMWLARHTPVNTDPIIDNVLKHLEETYSEGKGYKTSHGIRVVGYCFGGKYALRLAARDDVNAVAIAHGTMMAIEDFKMAKKPVTLACAENDPMLADELREAGVKVLQESNVVHEVKTYQNVPHGFSVYGNYSDSHIKSSQEQVFKQFVDFLGEH
ncbi:Similar to Protein AIM2; acc. no. P39721 [Pyronema omphalodes CBS 100304]|uniref:Similar to Protein AIM2 acc. no. P39721 n=1 Tax=Pyronema omphalodes (strain CBS 100304) TaxID=1076935 RepID=U4LVY4_PYROM|nr:Similar to Protein AIM2; acc. no. P39721 [Pyronema omphalodes CBS 100304]